MRIEKLKKALNKPINRYIRLKKYFENTLKIISPNPNRKLNKGGWL